MSYIDLCFLVYLRRLEPLHYSPLLTSIGLFITLQRIASLKLTSFPPFKFVLKNSIPGFQKALVLFGVSTFVMVHMLRLKKSNTVKNVSSFHLGQCNLVPILSGPDRLIIVLDVYRGRKRGGFLFLLSDSTGLFKKPVKASESLLQRTLGGVIPTIHMPRSLRICS